MWTSIISLFTGGAGGIAIYLIVALGAGGVAAYGMHEIDNSSYEKLELSVASANQKALVAAVANQKKADAISTTSEASNIKVQQVIVTKTNTIIRKVPTYVTAQTDQSFPLPCGFVRLHDAAASGTDPASITLAPGLTDASACPVKASDAIGIIADNYGQYASIAAELTGLQDWVTAEAKALQTK